MYCMILTWLRGAEQKAKILSAIGSSTWKLNLGGNLGGDLGGIIQRLHAIRPFMVLQRGKHHEIYKLILRFRQTGPIHFAIHTVDAFPKFFYILIFVKKFDDLRIA